MGIYDPRDFNWQFQQHEAEEVKPSKPFASRAMESSRCPKCKMLVRSRGRDVCLANGQTIDYDRHGLAGECAFDPTPVEQDDG